MMTSGCPFNNETFTYTKNNETKPENKKDLKEQTIENETSKTKKIGPCYYHKYLQLDKILNANKSRSEQFGEFTERSCHKF